MDNAYAEGLDPHGVATDREAVALPAQKASRNSPGATAGARRGQFSRSLYATL
jgi:hypothetical protein